MQLSKYSRGFSGQSQKNTDIKIPVPEIQETHLKEKAEKKAKKWRRGPESNRSKRFCRPLPNRLATTPRLRFVS